MRDRQKRQTDLLAFQGPDDEYDPLSQRVIGCAIEVHRTLGPGLSEAIYEECLCMELARAGIRFQRQLTVPVFYKGEPIGKSVIIDLLIEEVLCVELKAVDHLLDLHKAQVHTYLKVLEIQIGLLLNFNTFLLKDGVRRITRI